MAGREKKAPPSTMSGPGRKTDKPAAANGSVSKGLKTIDTQTQTLGPSRRSSVLPSPRSVAQKKRFSSPYAMRSESPVRVLRNGKQQRLKDTSMLDGIPIVKRTRSLMSESDTSSVLNATFNDTASVDFSGMVSVPDSPLSSRQNSFLYPDSTKESQSVASTPRRGRMPKAANSETGSLASSPMASPSLTKQKKNEFPLKGRTLRKKLVQTKEIKTRKGNPVINVTTKETEGKRKRGKAGESPDVESVSTPVKKIRKNARQAAANQNVEVDNKAKASPVATKNTTPAVKKKQPMLIKLSDAKIKALELTKLNKKLTNKAAIKSRKNLLVPHKAITNGKKIGRPLKMTNQQLARKIYKNTRGKANHGIPKTTKPIVMKKINKASLKKIIKTEFPIIKKRMSQPVESKTAKSEESSSVACEQTQDDLPDDSSRNTLPGKKKIVLKPKESTEPKPVPTTVDVSVATDTPPIRKTKKLVAASKVLPRAPLKVRKTLQNMKREPASPLDGETFKTLTEVSKILMEIAEKSPERVVGNNIESESDSKTPVPLSPKASTDPLKLSSEVNGVCAEETQNELTHVSPINSLATKLRRKLSQSPTVTNPDARSTRGSISMTNHIVALPIINSLSDAAKQTSSFLKTASESSGPLTKKETQWKVNKKLIYHRIKPSKQGSLDKLNSSMKGRVSALLSRRSHSYSRQVPIKDYAKVMSKISCDQSEKQLKPCSETEANKTQEVLETVNTATTEEQIPEESTKPAPELDSNENKVEATVDNQSAKTVDDLNLNVGTESEKEDIAIPEKDKENDNHSSLIKNSSTIENNLDSDKTEIKEKEIFSEKITSVESKNIETESNESSSDISNLTPNSDSPVEAKSIEPRREFSDDDESSFDIPPLRLDECIAASSLLASPTEQDVTEASIKPAPVSASRPSNGLDSESQGSNKSTPLPFEEEDMAAKVSVLGALGLQSNQAISEQAKAPKVPKVPKLRLVCRPTHKKHRRSANSDASTSGYKDKTYTVCREGESSGDWEPLPAMSVRDPPLDPCTRTLLWYPRMPISNGKVLESLVDVITPEPGIGVGDGLTETNADGTEKSAEPLVIPEKSASFGIHPGRLCKDVCCYCHNKFGLFDTPLHVAQLKGEEKQQAVLTREPLLTLESCLCDACFRHLDRPGAPRLPKPPTAKPRPLPNQICCFNNCNQQAAHPMMRKWKRRVRLMLRLDEQDPKASNWMCEKHYTQMARVSSCSMCRRRHAIQQMYKLEASAAPRLNQLLVADGVPVQLNGNSYLCKKCRYYASLRLRCEDYTQLNSGNRIFLRDHRSRVLKSLNVEPNTLPEVFPEREMPKRQAKKKIPEEAPPKAMTPPSPSVVVPHAKAPKQPRLKVSSGGGKPSNSPTQRLPTMTSSSGVRPNNSPVPRHPSPATRYPNPVSRQPNPVPCKGGLTITRQPATTQVRPSEKNDLRRMATQNANMLSRLNVSYTTTRPNTATTSASLTPAVTIMPIPPAYPNSSRQDPYTFTTSPPGQSRQEFPTRSDVAMNSSFEFQPLEEGSMWQKVNATFQFDKKTRQLWHQLHAPYGSYTSFLRHLVLLETHWRNGDLALTPSATPRARQYLSSVQNRIQAYEGVPSDPETSSLEPGPLICDVRSLATESTDSWNTQPSSK